MDTVTVSPSYRVVIPSSIRKALGIQPGQRVHAIQYGNRIELIPVRTLREARGFLGPIDTTVEREEDRV
ncbi:MAG: AbrB/MazE/SpoVT family DNA-binding domain-containing protein [Candidatus Omnitrophica bacterium]|nr:hypothetical protein [bacterium]NUN98233.1 AbrB/MazE/SpoVT family DNA-binding domain-containing protein [Candidatus Omnitrophota bacterium]